MKLAALVFLFSVVMSTATNYYSAPLVAYGSGDGSIANPWNLAEALNKTTNIAAGDTLYLRGGTYNGSGFFSSISGSAPNFVTVRSYLGEWAVVSDGQLGILMTNLPNSTNDITTRVPIANSESWQNGSVIFIGTEQLQIGGKLNLTNWQMARAWNGSTNTAHSSNDVVRPSNDFIEHSGTNVIFRDFEIASSGVPLRFTGLSNYIGAGLDLHGKGNKAINLIVRNVGHPGIGFWDQGAGGEINGCILWGNGVYDAFFPQNPSANAYGQRGNASYMQNSTDFVLVKNNIVFRNFTLGFNAFGETGPVLGFNLFGNIGIEAPGTAAPLSFQSGSSTMTSNTMAGNRVLGHVNLGYQSKTNRQQNVWNNTVVALSAMDVNETVSGSLVSNIFLMASNVTVSDNSTLFYECPWSATNGITFSWDYNSYYFFSSTHPSQFAFKTNGAAVNNLIYTDWKTASGFDAHSSLSTAWPVNYLDLDVRQLDYDANRWHVSVINTTSSNTVNLDLYGMGITNGQSIDIRDAQNYFTSLFSGVCSSQFYPLPITQTNVSEITGTILHYTNEHTNVQYPKLFNAFVVIRSQSGTLAQTGPGQSRSKGRR